MSFTDEDWAEISTRQDLEIDHLKAEVELLKKRVEYHRTEVVTVLDQGRELKTELDRVRTSEAKLLDVLEAICKNCRHRGEVRQCFRCRLAGTAFAVAYPEDGDGP